LSRKSGATRNRIRKTFRNIESWSCYLTTGLFRFLTP
jgi:hypothetical protein